MKEPQPSAQPLPDSTVDPNEGLVVPTPPLVARLDIATLEKPETSRQFVGYGWYRGKTENLLVQEVNDQLHRLGDLHREMRFDEAQIVLRGNVVVRIAQIAEVRNTVLDDVPYMALHIPPEQGGVIPLNGLPSGVLYSYLEEIAILTRTRVLCISTSPNGEACVMLTAVGHKFNLRDMCDSLIEVKESTEADH